MRWWPISNNGKNGLSVIPKLIFHARSGDDVRRAKKDGRTAIIFGFQNPSPIEDDIGLVEIFHDLGVRFMQLTYNNQSLLATGCYDEMTTELPEWGVRSSRK